MTVRGVGSSPSRRFRISSLAASKPVNSRPRGRGMRRPGGYPFVVADALERFTDLNGTSTARHHRRSPLSRLLGVQSGTPMGAPGELQELFMRRAGSQRCALTAWVLWLLAFGPGP